MALRNIQNEVFKVISHAKKERAQSLVLNGAGLRALPLDIVQLTQLTSLDLSGNQLTSLPPEIGLLTQLEELKLPGNQLKALPPEIGQLAQLRSLNLARNQLKALPPEIGQLAQLRSLDLARNQLKALPPEIGQLTQLTFLEIDDNQLAALPTEIALLTSLEGLNISGNNLATLPTEIWKLTQLRQLGLLHSRLTALPPEIGQLTQLHLLGLSDNHLTELPPEIGLLTQLWGLHLSGNRLIALPPEITHFTKLEHLYLSRNQLTELQPEIAQLSQLKELDLSRNQLVTLPPEIDKLTQLTELKLSGNQLTSLPLEIGNLNALEILIVENNPLSAEILRLGEEGKLIAYLQELPKERQGKVRSFNEAKLLLIGPGEVGKSWLLQALQGKKPVNVGSTKGIEVARQPLNLPHPAEKDRKIHFNCWDFGGQDHYQITHQIFFSPKAIYLMVWKPRPGIDPDLTARLERIELSAKRTAKVFIVSTHSDENIPAVVGEQAIRERFGELIGGFFKVDSAKGPDGTGITELKLAIAEAAANLEGMDEAFPNAWHDASTELRGITKPTILFSDFAALCEKYGMNAESAEALALIMDVQGHIVFFVDAASSGKAGVSRSDN